MSSLARGMPLSATDMNPKRVLIMKTAGVMSAAFLCLAMLATPVGASMLLWVGRAGFGATDPGALILVGAVLVCMGVWTRRVLSPRGAPRKSP